jgi:hypothetical protein
VVAFGDQSAQFIIEMPRFVAFTGVLATKRDHSMERTGEVATKRDHSLLTVGEGTGAEA